MKAIDLFCGAGGLTTGLRWAGWDVVLGIDVDPAVGRTYVNNNPGTRFLAADLRFIKYDEIQAVTGSIPSEELLLAGCAPCQPFSKQRRSTSQEWSSDATLLMEFARLVRALRPKAVLMENVPGLALNRGRVTLGSFIRSLRKSGYNASQGILNACDYGVPQHRRRYVLLAVKGAPVLLPQVNNTSEMRLSNTVRETIGDFPAIDAGETDPVVPNHCSARLSPMNLARIKATPADGGSRRDWPENLELECHKSNGVGFSDVYGRMWWDRVAPTLTSRCNSLSNGRFGHPDQHRAISLREAAALQSFPNHYEFFGAKNRIAQWIGNAVPVRFAEVLGVAAMRAAT